MDLAPELEPMDITPMVERAASQITERYPDADITVKNAQQDSGSEYPQFGNGCLGIA